MADNDHGLLPYSKNRLLYTTMWYSLIVYIMRLKSYNTAIKSGFNRFCFMFFISGVVFAIGAESRTAKKAYLTATATNN